jgi:DNA-binding beta-propeller fold protein YncE
MSPPSRLALLAVLAATLAVPAPSRAAEAVNHPFEEQASFNGESTPAHSLEDPCGLAVAAEKIYVADYYHQSVDGFQLGPPRYLSQVGTGSLNGPCGLALDASGDLYVDEYHEDVLRFTAAELAAHPPGPGLAIDAPAAEATGVAVDPATGDLYVDERTDVARYEAPVHPGETPVRIGLGSLADGYGLAVSSFSATAGYVYVADAATGTVKVYDPSTSLTDPVAEIDGAGTPQGGFDSLVDAALAVDPSTGHLFVLDDTEPGFEAPAAVIDEFNPAGLYRGQLPHAIVDGGPSGLAAAGGSVYVTSGNGERAEVLAFGPGAPGHVLTAQREGAGSGTVSSEPAGIFCGAACAAEFNEGATVTLTASPGPGSAFSGWTGCPSPSGPLCAVTLAADLTVRASFTDPPAASRSAAATGPGAPPALASPSALAPPVHLRHRAHRRSHARHGHRRSRSAR